MRATASIAGLLALALAGCGDLGPPTSSQPRPGPPRQDARVGGPLPLAPARITLSSPAFRPGATIPRSYTCTGEGRLPPLRWTRPPAGTRELALLVEDPDARGGTFVHWLVLGLSSTSRGLPAGTRPATLRQGRASSGRVGYEPPCPPAGTRPHRYLFALYALRRPLGLGLGASPAAARRAIDHAAIARGVLVGRYGR